MIKKHSANVKRFVAFKVTRIMGVYPVISLKEARGPAVVSKSQKHQYSKSNTFEAVTREWC